jgi:predicted NBD/HSP70 family sugar kinase
MAPKNSAPHPPDAGTSQLLELIRTGRASTRQELVRMSGLSRSTVSQRLEGLLARGLVIAGDQGESMGGRPPGSLLFNPKAGFVLVADCGASQTHTGIADLGGDVLIGEITDRAIAEGPEGFLAWLEARLDEHLREASVDPALVRGVGVGLPGPVEHRKGRPVSPPIMPGWDGYPVAERLAETFSRPALVDNDVNIMALGEHRLAHNEVRDMLFVKVGTGIGCGLVLGGNIHRGAHGAAGDIGHIHVPGHDDVLCSCGNIGCLESVASGGALAAQLSDVLPRDAKVSDVVDHVLHGDDPRAVAAVRNAGREIGGVLAGLVNTCDPDVIVIGGQMALADRPLIAGIREIVYRRSLPLATHNLRIIKSSLDERAGIVGAALMVVERVLTDRGASVADAAGAP